MKTVAREKADQYSVNILTTKQARLLFNKAVRQKMGVEAKVFIENYQSGKYDKLDDCDLLDILMLLPFTGYSAIYGKQSCAG